jgi:hypothetical protein
MTILGVGNKDGPAVSINMLPLQRENFASPHGSRDRKQDNRQNKLIAACTGGCSKFIEFSILESPLAFLQRHL